MAGLNCGGNGEGCFKGREVPLVQLPRALNVPSSPPSPASSGCPHPRWHMRNRVGIYKNPSDYLKTTGLYLCSRTRLWRSSISLKDMMFPNHSSICPSFLLPWLLLPTAKTELESLQKKTPASYLAPLLRAVLRLTVLGQSPSHEVQLGTEVEPRPGGMVGPRQKQNKTKRPDLSSLCWTLLIYRKAQ